MEDVSALKNLDVEVIIDDAVGSREEIMSRAVADPAWDILDRVLTSSFFPNLAKVKFTLQQSLVVNLNVQRPHEAWRDINAVWVLHLEVESALRPSFSRLIQNPSISLELSCPVFADISY